MADCSGRLFSLWIMRQAPEKQCSAVSTGTGTGVSGSSQDHKRSLDGWLLRPESVPDLLPTAITWELGHSVQSDSLRPLEKTPGATSGTELTPGTQCWTQEQHRSRGDFLPPRLEQGFTWDNPEKSRHLLTPADPSTCSKFQPKPAKPQGGHQQGLP